MVHHKMSGNDNAFIIAMDDLGYSMRVLAYSLEEYTSALKYKE